MKILLMPLLLQLAGVIVVIAEIFIPSGGLLGVIALGLFGYSLFMVFTDVSTTAGVWFVVGDLLLIPALVLAGIKVLSQSPATLNSTLSRASGVVSQFPEMIDYQGKKGRSLSPLHPGGTAEIDGKRVDVVSRGEYIDRDRDLEVIDVTANQIIVQEIKE